MSFFTRRQLITGAAACCFAPDIQSANALPAEQSQIIDDWMKQWTASIKAPQGTLHVSRFVEPIWFLTKPIRWFPNPGQEQKFKAVEVPIGFVTDFASIPRIFWSLLRPDGEYTYPAILHDYLYWTQIHPRDFADEIFKIAMEDFKIDHSKIITIYRTVRVGGQSAWDENARLKKSGEKRILTKFPDDPRIRWEDWRKRPDVF